jgi:hypothetical protein
VPLGDRLIRTRLLTALFIVLALAVACGGSVATTPPPTASPTPTPTPDPHLTAPASVDRVYAELRKAGLQMAANTADTGSEPVKTLNLTYEAWPLILEEFSSAEALETKTGFDPKKKPLFGDPPFTFTGLNIYITYGPQVQNNAPTEPDARFIAAADKLVLLLDPLLGPLRQSSVVEVAVPSATPSPSPSPTKKPKPTKSPKPTKKPKP